MSSSGAGLQPRDVARVLSDIAALMEMNGRDPFRTRAFATAARALEGTDANLEALARADRLTTLTGIGPAIAAIIGEIVLTGRSRIREELEAETPIGLFDLMRIPALGPKRIRTLYADLGVDSLDALEKVIDSGKLASLPGIGPKTAEKIAKGLSFARTSRGRRRYPEALESAVRLVEWLHAQEEVGAAQIAGALRRRLEIVDGIDLVAATIDPEATLSGFGELNGADRPQREGDDVVSVGLLDGMRARLRCVSGDSFVAAMAWETGNEAHLAELTAHATIRGFSLTRDGLYRDGEPVALDREEALYEAVGLAYVPPELREGLGEVAAAAEGRAPSLLRLEDLQGTFHCHTTYSDGKATLVEMADAARDIGWSYLGIADHSRSAGYAGGLSVEALGAQRAEITRLNRKKAAGERFRIFHGIESDILTDGSLDYPDEVLAELDYVVGSVHSAFAMSGEEMTRRVLNAVRNPYLTMLGHPTGRLLLTRRGYDLDVAQVIEEAAEHGVIIEINANPHRLDLDWREVRKAAARGVLIAINPDAHSIAALGHVAFGVHMARKAGLEPEQVINCWSLDRVESYLAERKQARES